MVSPGGTYIAGGIIVHNKGCFLPDAPILKADGSQAPIRAPSSPAISLPLSPPRASASIRG